MDEFDQFEQTNELNIFNLECRLLLVGGSVAPCTQIKKLYCYQKWYNFSGMVYWVKDFVSVFNRGGAKIYNFKK